MLECGIRDSPWRPPATPRILVAVEVPTIAEMLGARSEIRDSTYSMI